MVPVSELLSLCIWVVQQAGIVLAVGAQTVLLAAYLLNIHSEKDEHTTLMRAAHYLLGVGLVAIAVSGTAAVALHILLQQYNDVLFAPAFIFKWVLILATALAYIGEEDWLSKQQRLTQASARGLIGGLWYAMLLVHLVAPVMQWVPLLLLFVSWMVVFVALWGGFVGVMHFLSPHEKAARAERTRLKSEELVKAKEAARVVADEEAKVAVKLAVEIAEKKAKEKAKEVVVVKKLPEPAPLPVIVPIELPPPPVVQAAPPPPPPPSTPPSPPIVAAPPTPASTSLPTIRVMPRTIEELAHNV